MSHDIDRPTQQTTASVEAASIDHSGPYEATVRFTARTAGFHKSACSSFRAILKWKTEDGEALGGTDETVEGWTYADSNEEGAEFTRRFACSLPTGRLAHLRDVDVRNPVSCIGYVDNGENPPAGQTLKLSGYEDPNVFELVSSWISQRFPKYPLGALLDFRLTWGRLEVDVDALTQLPTKIEERIFTSFNKTDANEEHDEKFRFTSRRSETFEASTKLTSSTELKLGLSFAPTALTKLNADILTKNQVEISKSFSQTFYEEMVIETTQKWTVPPQSTYTFRAVSTKGLVLAPVRGKVVFDALVRLSFFIMETKQRVLIRPFWLSEAFPSPLDRQIDYAGVLTSESYQRTDWYRESAPITDGDRMLLASTSLGQGGWISSG